MEKGAKDGSVDDTGLANQLLFSKGSRILITRNRWASLGLVNGTMGTIFDIVWDDGVKDPFATMPAVILVVVLDNYGGPASMNIAGVNAVPVIFTKARP